MRQRALCNGPALLNDTSLGALVFNGSLFDTATVLAQHAIDTSANMIVMGAYGSRRLRERLFGGVTKWMVGKPPLPLFLAR